MFFKVVPKAYSTSFILNSVKSDFEVVHLVISNNLHQNVDELVNPYVSLEVQDLHYHQTNLKTILLLLHVLIFI